MVVLVSTEPRRVIGVLVGGLTFAAALWMVHLNSSGFVGLVATVSALLIAALTVAFAISVSVEGWLDIQSRRRFTRSIRLDAEVSSAIGGRCRLCRRPLIAVGNLTLCATCDQRPSL